MIIFKLSMPHANSWNGKWSGEKDVHIITKPDKYVPKDIIDKNYYYDFGDGWGACIDVIKMNGRSKEYKQMIKNNKGFCGYDWMVNSIINNNEIRHD